MNAADRLSTPEKSSDVDLRERWKILCEQASNERDSSKLSELVQQINEVQHEREAYRAATSSTVRATQRI